MKTVLNQKTNKRNIVNSDAAKMVSITGVTITPRTVRFNAVEKNGKLAPLAQEMIDWAKKEGFEMSSRPLRKKRENGMQTMQYTLK